MATRAKQILIVDDDDDYRSTLADLISAELPFAKVASADTAEKALEMIRSQPVDLLVSDYRLPDHDGVWLVEAAREILPNAKFLMLSAEPDQYLLIKAGCTVLSKPVNAEVLTKMVRRLVAPRSSAKK